MPIILESPSAGGGGGSGTVTNVSSTNTAVAVANPTTTPALTLATLDVIAADGPPAANWSNGSKKITSLANGSAAQDAAAFGQIPTALPPNGAAGGDLAGTYPNPTVKAITEASGPTDLVIGTIADGQVLKRVGGTLVSVAAGAGTVTNVASGDTSIVVTNPTTTPSLQIATLDVVAANRPAAANWSNNAKKITSLANGSAAQDAAAFGQIPTALPPNGAASGDLAGTYPSPTISATFSRFAPQLAGIVSPVGPYVLVPQNAVTITANDCRLVRVVVPYTGTLHGLSAYVGASSGNVSLAVYDTGQTTGLTWTRLYTTGTVACGSATSWMTVDPNLGVTAGQQLMFAITADNATASFGILSQVNAAVTVLPASFLSTPDSSQQTAARFATSHPAPATLTPGSGVTFANVPFLMARVA